MAVKCFHNDFGFCKFGDECRLEHSEQVCRETSCRRKYCSKRHPKACKNYFLKKHCRFGNICRYDHFFDCENCDNLLYIIKKETKDSEERLKKKDEAITRMAKEIKNLEKEKVILERKGKVSKDENKKLQDEIRQSGEEKSKLKSTITDLKREIGVTDRKIPQSEIHRRSG